MTDRQALGKRRGGLRETKQQRCQIRIAGVAGFAIKTPDAIAPLTHPPTDSPAANPPLTGVDPGLREAGNCEQKAKTVDVTINPCMIGAGFLPLPSHLTFSPRWS